MGDWDDEEFEVPVLLISNNKPTKPKLDEEEEEEESETREPVASNNTKKPASAKAVKSEAELRKEKEADAKLLAKVKIAQLENETGEQRRLRERQIVEESDAAVAKDLFDGSAGRDEDNDGEFSGIGAIPIRTKQDHINFALVCTQKMEDSTPLCLGAFYKDMSSQIKDKLTVETLDDVIKMLTLVRDEKKKTQAKASSAPKLSKKQLEANKKKHKDMFGDVDEVDRFDSYSNIEDDYMF